MQRQKGFLLAQMAVFVLILFVVSAYAGKLYMEKSRIQAKDTRAEMVGDRLALINDAAKSYATAFFTGIQKGEPITNNNYTVPQERVLEPSLVDFNGLGFLRKEAVDPIKYGSQNVSFDVKFRINTEGCTIPSCRIEFYSKTTAPLLDESNKVDVRRIVIAAKKASAGNGGVSMPADMGNSAIFVGLNNNKIGDNPGSVAGLIAVRNGYDSQGFAEFFRVDGSLSMTGNADLNGHDINRIGTANIVTAKVGDVIATGNVAATGAVSTEDWFRSKGDGGWYSEKYNGGLHMTDDKWLRSYADKGILTGGEIKGGTINSLGRVKASEFIQVDGIAVPNTACSPNGLIAKDSIGAILACQSGVWKTQEAKVTVIGGTKPMCGPNSIAVAKYWVNDAGCNKSADSWQNPLPVGWGGVTAPACLKCNGNQTCETHFLSLWTQTACSSI